MQLYAALYPPHLDEPSPPRPRRVLQSRMCETAWRVASSSSVLIDRFKASRVDLTSAQLLGADMPGWPAWLAPRHRRTMIGVVEWDSVPSLENHSAVFDLIDRFKASNDSIVFSDANGILGATY